MGWHDHWQIAYASAQEVDVYLGILFLCRAVRRGMVVDALNLFDAVGGAPDGRRQYPYGR